MFDLDGVVYVDGHAVRHAPRASRRRGRRGAHIAFITNNASRTPEPVAAQLSELGVEATPGDVVTSAQAAARLLLDRFGEGARSPSSGPTACATRSARRGWSRSGSATRGRSPWSPDTARTSCGA